MENLQTSGRNMITALQYASIACTLDKINIYQSDASAELVAMQNNLSGTLGDAQRKNTLRLEIEQVRKAIAEERQRPLTQVVEAIRRLNLHVESHYGPLNSFLSANNITVSPYFASVSLAAGFTISQSNIGESCE